MPQAARALARTCRRIDRDHDALQRRRFADAATLQQRARPQRVGPVLDDLALELLPPEPRAGIAPHHGLQKGRRQIVGVVARRRPRHHAGRILDQPFQQRCRARRGGDQLPRLRAEPQAELQHVEGVLRIAPLRHLVGPRAGKLRPAQALRVLGGKRLRDLAVAPFQPFSRRQPGRPLVPAMHRQQSGDALDHHLAHVMLGLADQRDTRGFFGCERRQPKRLRAHPFRAGARLAGAAAADHQPGVPGLAVGRESGRGLVVVGEDFPVLIEVVHLPRLQVCQQVDPLFLGPFAPVAPKAFDGVLRGLEVGRGHPAASLYVRRRAACAPRSACARGLPASARGVRLRCAAPP